MDIDTFLWPKGNGPDCPQVYALLDARDEAIAPRHLVEQPAKHVLVCGVCLDHWSERHLISFNWRLSRASSAHW